MNFDTGRLCCNKDPRSMVNLEDRTWPKRQMRLTQATLPDFLDEGFKSKTL